jgi:tRNA pseudouridine55 synthase
MSAVQRGLSGLSGVLLVDKPEGMTSHDVVNRIRRATGERRVGHAGTLDPLASGLLVVLVGPATRLEPYLSSKEKGYEATIRFGAETDTDDAEGQVVSEASVPAEILTAAKAEEVLSGFVGESSQVPPQYSAIKVGGKVAHRVARSGGELELAARCVSVLRAELLGLDADSATWRVAFDVSKGTYIRALARDIGRACGSAAHLSALTRVSSGALTLAEAHSLTQIDEAAGAQRIRSLFIDPVRALSIPVIEVPRGLVADGRPLNLGSAEASLSEGLIAVSCDGSLTALYRSGGQRLKAEVVFATPVVRTS